MNKIRAWLKFPDPPRWYTEAFLLDGESLTEVDRWYMPIGGSGYHMIRFTPDDRQIIVWDSTTIEHWPIPPRSWLMSALHAGGITLALVVVVAFWRFWRRRKGATIMPIAPS